MAIPSAHQSVDFLSLFESLVALFRGFQSVPICDQMRHDLLQLLLLGACHGLLFFVGLALENHSGTSRDFSQKRVVLFVVFVSVRGCSRHSRKDHYD